MIFVIEKLEYKIYCREKNITYKDFPLKSFRKQAVQRKTVQDEISLVAEQLNTIPQITIEYNKIESSLVNDYIAGFSDHLLDFFDYTILDFCNRNGYALLSDDGDFNSKECIGKIYTANDGLLKNCL